jgi:Tfp pilus assembly protein PilO
MMRTRLKPDRRSAFLLGAVLVGTVAGGGGLVYQQESQLGDVVKQLRDKEKQRDDSARIASRLADTELRYREDTDRLKFLESALPSVAYVPTLLKQIEQLCTDTHNVVRGVRPEAAVAKPVRPAVRRTDPEAQGSSDAPKPEEKPKPPDPYDRLTIQVSLTGGYKEYQEFLQRLTQFPKIVAVDRVQLRPRGDNDHKGGPPQLDVDMQLTAFILKDAPPVPGPAATAAPPPSTAAMPGTGAPDAASPAESPAAAPPVTPKNRAVPQGHRET